MGCLVSNKISFLIVIWIIPMISVSVCSLQFNVGGKYGWIKPTLSQTQSYNQWAANNRFHVGDTLYFEYEKDSVLLVNYTDYKNCITENPIAKYEDGKTIFRFDRFGFFYFISGNSGHCKAGQKLDIRVMVQSVAHSPEPAASPENGGRRAGGGSGGSWSPLAENSSDKISVVSNFVGVFVGSLVALCLFI